MFIFGRGHLVGDDQGLEAIIALKTSVDLWRTFMKRALTSLAF